MLKIITHPHRTLRLKAKPILKIDSKIKALAESMLKTVVPDPREPLGVGLAAPQVNVSVSMFVMLMPNKKMEVIINPQITKTSKKMLSDLQEKNQFMEGCLSVPGYYGFVDRPQKIKVRYQNLKNNFKLKVLKPPFSSYFFHEYDHLNGILFIDHIKLSGEQLFFGKGRERLQPVKNPFL